MPTTTISDLQPRILLRRVSASADFDLVLRWVPKLVSWLPGKNDSFALTIKITYQDNSTKYVNHRGQVIGAPPTGADIPTTRPKNEFMLDPHRRKETIPFAGTTGPTTGQEDITKWLVGKRPEFPQGHPNEGDPRPVDCSIMTDPFPFTDHGFGVCHLLQEAPPSRAAWRIREAAKPMVHTALQKYESRVAPTRFVIAADPDAKSSLIAESLAYYFVLRPFYRAGDIPTKVVPAINAGFAELESKCREFSGALAASTAVAWRQPIFTYLSRTDPNSIQLSAAHSRGTRGDQIEARYEYAAIVTEALGNEKHRTRLEQLADDAAQTRSQIRLRAMHGGMLVDFYDFANRSLSETRMNSSEIIGLGRTFSGFKEEEVAKWKSVELSVEHVPGIVKPDFDLVVKDVQTFHYKLPDGTSVISKFGTVPIPLNRTEIEEALANDQSHAPTPPRFIDFSDDPNDPPPSPRLNYDLVQTDVTEPQPSDDRAVDDRPRSKDHVGYNTGDGRLEALMNFKTDGTAGALQTSGGFNVYIMPEPDSGPLLRYFQDWTGSSLSRYEWLFPALDKIRPFLITRRYSYLQDLREALTDEHGNLPTEKIRELMDDPPKQTLFQRPDAVTDEHPDAVKHQVLNSVTDDSGKKMPNALNKGFHVWSTDLRRGIKLPAYPDPREFLTQWDPSGIIDFDWDPTKKRDGNSAGAKPQAYRIWVTTSDFFDQESNPVPVYCHDMAATAPSSEHERWLFRPMRRAPIQAPPGDDGPNPASQIRARTLKFIEVVSRTDYRIEVEWSTPFFNETGAGPQSTSAKRPNRNDLVSHVAIFRRMLQRAIPDSELVDLKRFDDSLPTIPALPQWTTMRDEMLRQGWEQFGDHVTVDGASTGSHVWTYRRDLAHYDRGYDYVALIGVQIKDGSGTAAFFSPNSLVDDGGKRLLQFVKWNGSDYVSDTKPINETPRASSVELTKPHNSNPHQTALKNDEEPRGVASLEALPLMQASPILPVPGILSRDQTLAKLLTYSFKDQARQRWFYDCSRQSTDEPEEEEYAELTIGQIAMLEAAIARTVGKEHICDTKYKNTRKLLAADLRTVRSELPSFLQHPSIGFRGIKYLKWTYKPLKSSATNVIQIDESEAITARVFQVRTEIDPKNAETYATVKARADIVDLGAGVFRCRLDPLAGETELLGIHNVVCDKAPTLVRLEPAGSVGSPSYDGQFAWFGNVIEVASRTPSNACSDRGPISSVTLKISMAEKPAGFPSGPIIAWLYVAQPLTIVDQKIENHDLELVTQQLPIPIGGGPAEMFGWWVSTISAQEREAEHSRRAFAMELMPPTIEPRVPEEIRLGPPTGRQHVLNPSDPQESKWLPSQLQANPDLVRITPHTVLTWRPYPAAVSGKTGIIVKRDFRRIVRNPTLASLRSLSSHPWFAIKSIEEAPEKTPLEKPWLDAINFHNSEDNKGWLFGAAVDQPNRTSPSGRLRDFIAPVGEDRPLFLDGNQGIKLVVPPTAGGAPQPAFIDYHRDDDKRLPMWVNYEYQYQLQAYIDLGSHLDDKFRFLKGKPSEITHWQKPENTPIELDTTITEDEVPYQEGPFVRFEIGHSLRSLIPLFQLDDPTSWRYRVVIRRKLPFSLSADGSVGTPLGWEDVGKPLSLWPQTPDVVVEDRSIERAHAEESVNLEYIVYVSQFAAFDNGEERPVRKQDNENGFAITLSGDDAVKLPSTDLKEFVRVVRLNII